MISELINEYKNLKKLDDRKRQYILSNRVKFSIEDKSDKLLYPGFRSKNNEDFNLIVKLFESSYTPPRGNLLNPDFILLGYKPGYSIYSFREPNWLLGPTSALVNLSLLELNVYPYYTNLFKSPFSENDKNFQIKLLKQELNLILNNFPNLKIVCLGKYDEFEEIKVNFNNVYQMKHPSYFLRLGKPKDFYNDLKKIIKE